MPKDYRRETDGFIPGSEFVAAQTKWMGKNFEEKWASLGRFIENLQAGQCKNGVSLEGIELEFRIEDPFHDEDTIADIAMKEGAIKFRVEKWCEKDGEGGYLVRVRFEDSYIGPYEKAAPVEERVEKVKLARDEFLCDKCGCVLRDGDDHSTTSDGNTLCPGCAEVAE